MRRIFVADPTCAVTFGHPLNALNYFADVAAQYCSDVRKVASCHLPVRAGDPDDGIARYFEFLYEPIMAIERSATLRYAFMQEARISREETAFLDALRFLADFDITAQDGLLFPGMDYYSLVGFLRALKGLAPQKRPHLFIRLLGVLEQTCHHLTPGDAQDRVFALLRAYRSAHGGMSLCAETPAYAAHLSARLSYDVPTVPYWVGGIEPLDYPATGPVTFLLGGSARADKGFFEIRDIISAVNRRIEPWRTRFIIQSLPDAQIAQHEGYIKTLVRLPNVEYLPGNISYPEILSSFARSHVILMPYDQPTYALRGSAMMMEAICFGRPVICTDNTGFGGQARDYGARWVCDSRAGFVDAIVEAVETPPADMNRAALELRDAYLTDVKQSYDGWINT